MRVVERPIDLNLAQILARRAMPGRSMGRPHVTEIIRWIDHRVIHQGQRKPYDQLSPSERKRMGAFTSMGFVWEDLVAQSLAPMLGGEIVRPGELELDGIVGTPDGLNLSGMAVEETKATWRSSRRSIETDYWSWLAQIKAYCQVLN